MDLLHKLKAKFKKPKEVVTLEIIEDKCVGCGKCVEKMCNFGAINLDAEKDIISVMC